jgi:hypothetical protein
VNFWDGSSASVSGTEAAKPLGVFSSIKSHSPHQPVVFRHLGARLQHLTCEPQ